MDTPFIYDSFVSGKNFIGRREELSKLETIIREGGNAVLIEPERSGKTSLVQQALYNLRTAGKRFRSVEVSLLNIRTVADFCMRLGDSMLRAVCSTPDEFRRTVESLLCDTHFVFDPDEYSKKDRILSLSWDIDSEDVRAVLSLPYRLCPQGESFHVIIDQFQNIMLTENGESLINTFEEVLQAAKDTARGRGSYILLGSGVNAMDEIFERRKRFFHLVERVKFSDVDEREIVDHIVKGFLTGGKVVDRDLAASAVRLFRNNLWEINHFCAICDSLAHGYVMEPILNEGLEKILAVNEPRFISIMNDLTTFQICLLRAICDGHTKFSSADIISHYNLSSSANVRRIKDALSKKEILCFRSDGLEESPRIIDPLFEYWLRKRYFEILK